MQSQQTTSEIVRQVISTLSESISALTLLVVEKKASNAEIPPQLPGTVDLVSNAADTLVVVARDLANTEYNEFPDIQSDILHASGEVEGSTKRLRASVSELSKADRAKGWQILSDSCGGIGKKTILLLEIVYGAEIKRVLAAAEKARQATREAERLAYAGGDPQEFADSAGKASGEINQVAAYLGSIADSQAAPGTQEQLREAGQALEKKAQQLIDEANRILGAPDDAKAKEAFSKVVKDVNDILESAKLPLKEDLGTDPAAAEEAAAKLKELLKMLPAVAMRAAQSPNDQAAIDALNELLDQIEDQMHKLGDNTGASPEIEKVMRNAAAIIAKMRPSQKKGGDWKNTLLASAQDLANQMALLLGEAKLEIAKSQGAAEQHALELAELLGGLGNSAKGSGNISAGHVDDLLRKVNSLEAAHSAARAQASPEKTNNQVVGKIEVVSDNISKATKRTKLAQRNAQDPLIKAYDSIAAQMAALGRAAKAGDGNGILLSARALGAFIQQLVAMLREIAASCKVPAQRDQLYKWASSLQDFGVQVKILASVKAASATPDTANDGQLVALTTNLGRVLEEALNTVDVVKLMQ